MLASQYWTKLSRIAVLVDENSLSLCSPGVILGAFLAWPGQYLADLTDWAEILHDNLIGVLANLGKGCGIFMIPGLFFCVPHEGPIF